VRFVIAYDERLDILKEPIEVWNILLFHRLSNSSISSNAILFSMSATIIDRILNMMNEPINIRSKVIRFHLFNEVGNRSARVSHYSLHWVLQRLNQRRNDFFVVFFLESLVHVVSNLTNAMKSSVPDLGVRVSKMLDDKRHHRLDLLDVIKVLSDL